MNSREIAIVLMGILLLGWWLQRSRAKERLSLSMSDDQGNKGWLGLSGQIVAGVPGDCAILEVWQ